MIKPGQRLFFFYACMKNTDLLAAFSNGYFAYSGRRKKGRCPAVMAGSRLLPWGLWRWRLLLYCPLSYSFAWL